MFHEGTAVQGLAKAGKLGGGGGGLDGLCEEELLIGLAKITILV